MPRLEAWHHDTVGFADIIEEASQGGRDMKIGPGEGSTSNPIFELNRHATPVA
jgi:hypothetical protein